MEKIIGLIDAPFTPFDAEGNVNLAPIPAYAQMLAANGLKGVFINGSSGEGYMLTPEERIMLAEKWIASVPEGFKVIVHVGSCCLRESVRLAAHAQKIGAWGIGAMAPPFPKIGRVEELVKYCETIAAAAPELPFYYYHIPAFNGAYLSMVEFLKAVDEIGVPCVVKPVQRTIMAVSWWESSRLGKMEILRPPVKNRISLRL